MRHFLCAIILFTSLPHLLAQKEFTFGSPGYDCFSSYYCYAPDKSYSFDRPIIFVLGKQSENALFALEKDSTRLNPAFAQYMFVYVNGFTGSEVARLNCLYKLADMLKSERAQFRQSLFLQVTDPSIGESHLDASNVPKLFRAVRLKGATNPIAQDFRQVEITAPPAQGTPLTVHSIPSGKAPVRTNLEVSGVVRDAATGEALPFANVRINFTNKGTTTNADGYFTLVNVPTDTSSLTITMFGYPDMRYFLNPGMDMGNVVIEMSQPAANIEEVEVVAEREAAMQLNRESGTTIRLSPRELEKLPNLGERDIMRAFQLMPGISSSNESSSGLYVRGGTPDQNLVLYDGFTVYQVDHLYGFFSAFNANAVKDVQLYKGGFESRFGGRLSSVTEIIGKEGNRKEFNIGGEISLLSANVFAEFPVGEKVTALLAFRRSYKGPIYNKIFDSFNRESENEAPAGDLGANFSKKVSSYFYDLNGKLTWRPTEKDVVSFSFYNGTDKLDNSQKIETPSFLADQGIDFNFSINDLTRYGNVGTGLKWSRKWNEKLYGNTLLTFSNYYSKRDRSNEGTISSGDDEETFRFGTLENNDLKDWSVKSDYEWAAFRQHKLRFGFFGSLYDIDYTYSQNDTSTILDKQNTGSVSGVYLQDQVSLLKDKISLLPGLRVSYFDRTGKLYYEPRLSATVRFSERWTASASTGKFYQFANRITREDILSGSRDFWVLSDGDDVPVSSSVHYNLGVSYNRKNYLFSVEAYQKYLYDLTEYSLRFSANMSSIDYNENFFKGSGTSRGIELLAQKKSGALNGWVSYTLGESRSRFDVYSDDWYASNQDVTHEFKLVTMYKVKRWEFGLTWVYATGRPYTAPSGAYSVDLLDGSDVDNFTVTSKNSQRLPDYHRLDFSTNYRLRNEDGKDRGYIGFSIFNLYNRKNVWYKEYQIVDNQILETDVNYLGFTPNLTLSLKLR